MKIEAQATNTTAAGAVQAKAEKQLRLDEARLLLEENGALRERIAELEAALATARRDGMKDAAKWHEVQSMELSGKASVARNFRQLLSKSDFHMESAATIRAALEGGKKE